MDLDLCSMSSLGVDTGLPSPWIQQDPEAALMQAVFSGSVGCDESLVAEDGDAAFGCSSTTTTPSDTPLHAAGNAYFHGGGWPMQALRSSECCNNDASPLPSMVSTGVSLSGGTNSSTTTTTAVVAVAGAADACSGGHAGLALTITPVEPQMSLGGPRTVTRVKAHRSQLLDLAQVQHQQQQPAPQPPHVHVQVEQLQLPLPPASKRARRAAQKAAAAGGTCVLQPFSVIKTYSTAVGAPSLAAINERLQRSWKSATTSKEPMAKEPAAQQQAQA